MRRLSPNSLAILFPFIAVACGGSSDESDTTGPDRASATTSDAASDAPSAVTSADSRGTEGSSSGDSQGDVVGASETGAPHDGAAAKDVMLADQAPAIAPGSVHVDIDGVRRDFPVVTDDWNLDGT